MTKFKQNIWPQGGRYFIDADGVKFKADNWKQLALRVTNYRKKAGQPVGDPEAEIQAQVCDRQPDYCVEDPGNQPVEVSRANPDRHNPGTFTTKVLAWLGMVLALRRAGGAKLVSRGEAARRAAICAACPQQRALSEACGKCNRSRREATGALLEGTQRINDKLKGCLVLQMDTSLAVHLDLGPEARAAALPAKCWRR